MNLELNSFNQTDRDERRKIQYYLDHKIDELEKKVLEDWLAEDEERFESFKQKKRELEDLESLIPDQVWSSSQVKQASYRMTESLLEVAHTSNLIGRLEWIYSYLRLKISKNRS